MNGFGDRLISTISRQPLISLSPTFGPIQNPIKGPLPFSPTIGMYVQGRVTRPISAGISSLKRGGADGIMDGIQEIGRGLGGLTPVGFGYNLVTGAMKGFDRAIPATSKHRGNLMREMRYGMAGIRPRALPPKYASTKNPGVPGRSAR